MSLPYRSGATFGLAGGVICAGASYVAAGTSASPDLAAWLQVASITVLVHAILALATTGRAARWGRRIATACLAGGFAAAFLIPPEAPRLLGVPLGSALMMILVGFVPLVVLPLCFARGFQSHLSAGSGGTPQPDPEPTGLVADTPSRHGAHPRGPR